MGDVSLADALVNLVRDVDGSLRLLVSAVCYVLAVCVFVQGCGRILKTSEDKFHAPSGWGTALCFVIAAVLVSLPSAIAALTETFFGTSRPPVAAVLGYGGGGGPDYARLLTAVFVIVNLVGLLAFVRGIFMLRQAADGQPQAGAARAAAHLIGGLAAWHIVGVIDALQTSLGIEVLRIGG